MILIELLCDELYQGRNNKSLCPDLRIMALKMNRQGIVRSLIDKFKFFELVQIYIEFLMRINNQRTAAILNKIIKPTLLILATKTNDDEIGGQDHINNGIHGSRMFQMRLQLKKEDLRNQKNCDRRS
ncbi:unnamed protein product [Paramecium octaurelia]|uniref:Uncharacterized protein n=1 Tax=Paramecium octaurelia TaxID=43137 RepID=A0A8S1UDB4_PAROT|nr:unnamed protein product [Paramecium octaurelia]